MSIYFEQMRGRGVRVIDDTTFQAVTPDAEAKERFVIVDAVGATESDLVDTVPLDRKPTVPLPNRRPNFPHPGIEEHGRIPSFQGLTSSLGVIT